MKKTNHVLHAVMTLITGGIWILVWVALALSRKNHNEKLKPQAVEVVYTEEKKAPKVKEDDSPIGVYMIFLSVAAIIGAIWYFPLESLANEVVSAFNLTDVLGDDFGFKFCVGFSIGIIASGAIEVFKSLTKDKK